MQPSDQADQVVARLRKAGVKVEVTAMPGRPYAWTPKAVLLHHTASSSTTSSTAEANDVRYLKADKPGWPAPIVQWYVGRTGTVWLISKGRANHAGSGSGLTGQGIPADLGNQYFWGIEVQSRGLSRDWTDEQIRSVHLLTAELCNAMGVGPGAVWRHKDYDDDSGKIDTQYPLDWHRKLVSQYLQDPTQDEEAKEMAAMQDYIEGQQAAREAYAKDPKIGNPPDGKGQFFRAGWNDVRWAANNLKGERGPKGDPGPQGLPGATHTHTKVTVAGPATDSP